MDLASLKQCLDLGFFTFAAYYVMRYFADIVAGMLGANIKMEEYLIRLDIAGLLSLGIAPLASSLLFYTLFFFAFGFAVMFIYKKVVS